MSTLIISGTGTKFRVTSRSGKGKVNVLTTHGIKTVGVSTNTSVKFAA